MLNTQTNTPEMEERILEAAAASGLPLDLSADFEHGQWWVTARDSGAQWSVVDADGVRSVDGFDFEPVTEGTEASPTGWEEG